MGRQESDDGLEQYRFTAREIAHAHTTVYADSTALPLAMKSFQYGHMVLGNLMFSIHYTKREMMKQNYICLYIMERSVWRQREREREEEETPGEEESNSVVLTYL